MRRRAAAAAACNGCCDALAPSLLSDHRLTHRFLPLGHCPDTAGARADGFDVAGDRRRGGRTCALARAARSRPATSVRALALEPAPVVAVVPPTFRGVALPVPRPRPLGGLEASAARGVARPQPLSRCRTDRRQAGVPGAPRSGRRRPCCISPHGFGFCFMRPAVARASPHRSAAAIAEPGSEAERDVSGRGRWTGHVTGPPATALLPRCLATRHAA